MEEAVRIAIDTAKKFVADYPRQLDEIKWVLFDDTTLEAYEKELERFFWGHKW